MQQFYCPNFNPIIFTIGPISFYWYGFMYVISFICAKYLLNRRRSITDIIWSKQEIEYLLCVVLFGVLIGGRVGYVIFYQWPFFSKNFLLIFKFWEGGMSFHGGLIGVIIAIIWFSYHKKQSFFKISDFIVPVVPIGLGLGRFGNFINDELWGRVTINTPWAMLFKSAISEDLLWISKFPEWKSIFEYYGALPRHPSQLYEMLMEGVVLYILLNILIYRVNLVGGISGVFLILYGLFRIIIECFREPDGHLGLIYNLVTLGQILSFPMIISGSVILYMSYKKIFRYN